MSLLQALTCWYASVKICSLEQIPRRCQMCIVSIVAGRHLMICRKDKTVGINFKKIDADICYYTDALSILYY